MTLTSRMCVRYFRSQIRVDVGGHFQIASLICSSLVLAATFFLLPVPRCALASVLVLFLLLSRSILNRFMYGFLSCLYLFSQAPPWRILLRRTVLHPSYESYALTPLPPRKEWRHGQILASYSSLSRQAFCEMWKQELFCSTICSLVLVVHKYSKPRLIALVHYFGAGGNPFG